MDQVIKYWNHFRKVLLESDIAKLRQEVEELGSYDLHNVLRRRKKVEWCEWHLNINGNDKAIEIAEEFHRNLERLKPSASIADQVHTMEETFLEYMPRNDHWNKIRDYFKQACEQNDPLMIVKAYTFSQQLSSRLNKHLAVNTYHALKLYCTILNCPILAQTQEYTEAFARIFSHPKLDKYSVRRKTVYRGIVLEDKKLADDYKEQTVILTTTFLSTSTNPEVAKQFSCVNSENAISVFCTYNINNHNRRTALNLRNLSVHPSEHEILILPHIPFIIRSVERTNDDRKMTISFDECDEKCIALDGCVSLTSVVCTSEETSMDRVLHSERYCTANRRSFDIGDHPNERGISLPSGQTLSEQRYIVQ